MYPGTGAQVVSLLLYPGTGYSTRVLSTRVRVPGTGTRVCASAEVTRPVKILRYPGILIGYLIRVRVGGARSSRARPGTGFENSFTALQAFYPELTSPGVGLQSLCSPV